MIYEGNSTLIHTALFTIAALLLWLPLNYIVKSIFFPWNVISRLYYAPAVHYIFGFWIHFIVKCFGCTNLPYLKSAPLTCPYILSILMSPLWPLFCTPSCSVTTIHCRMPSNTGKFSKLDQTKDFFFLSKKNKGALLPRLPANWCTREVFLFFFPRVSHQDWFHNMSLARNRDKYCSLFGSICVW